MKHEDDDIRLTIETALEEATGHHPEEPKTDEAMLKEIIREHGSEESKTAGGKLTLRKVLGGDLLTSDFVKRQIGLLILIALFFIIYIANGYSYRRSILEIDRLKDSLNRARIESLSSISRLTKYTRETKVIQMLRENGDTLLKVSNTPPIIVYDD